MRQPFLLPVKSPLSLRLNDSHRHSQERGTTELGIYSGISDLRTHSILSSVTKNFHLSTLLYKETVYTELIYSIVQLYR